MKKYNILFSIGLVFFAACKKKEEDTHSPKITISNPVDATMYKTGDSLHIVGEVTDEELHEMSIKISRTDTTLEYYSSNPYVHELSTYTINEYWKIPALSDTFPVKLVVTAYDHADHMTEKVITFTCRP
jgi:hypothetical protein